MIPANRPENYMKISKKKIKEITRLSVFDEIFRTQTNNRFYRAFPSNEPFYVHPPDEWNDDEESLFDLVTEIERRMKERILEIIESRQREGVDGN